MVLLNKAVSSFFFRAAELFPIKTKINFVLQLCKNDGTNFFYYCNCALETVVAWCVCVCMCVCVLRMYS